MKGMPINALIDMLQMAMPGLQSLGDEDPTIEINNRPELMAVLRTSLFDRDYSEDEIRVFEMHLAEFRRMIMEDEP